MSEKSFMPFWILPTMKENRIKVKKCKDIQGLICISTTIYDGKMIRTAQNDRHFDNFTMDEGQ